MSEPPILSALRESLKRFDLAGCRVLVGVSGGADSIALLQGVLALREEFDLDVQVGHVNHGLRGDESLQDARFVEQLAMRRGLPFQVRTVMVGEIAVDVGEGIEETARKVRLKVLEEIAQENNCASLALAHTADDCAETVLHYILRGTGLAGLKGIPAQRVLKSGVRIVRPMLSCSRRMVVSYLESIGEEYRTDSSNADTRFTRNRIRNELLPRLRAEFNPRVSEALLRLAEQAEELSGWVQEQARELLRRATVEEGVGHWRGDRAAWHAVSEIVQQEALRQIWDAQGWPRKGMGRSQWRGLLRGIAEGKERLLPGQIRLEMRGNLIYLTSAARCAQK